MRDCARPFGSRPGTAFWAVAWTLFVVGVTYVATLVVVVPAQRDARHQILAECGCSVDTSRAIPRPGERVTVSQYATIRRWRELSRIERAECDAQPVYSPRMDAIERSFPEVQEGTE